MADESPIIRTREEARAAGLIRYFTGVPCKRGHIAERRVSGKQCVECARELQAAFKRDHPEEHRARIARQNRKRDPEKVAAWLRAARAKDPERYREYDQRAYSKNKGAGSDYQKRKYARLDRAAAREAHKKWRRENPEKSKALDKRNREKNRATHKARGDRWRKAYPEAVAAIRDRRRAEEVGASGTYTKNDVRDLLKTYGRVCFYCGAVLTIFHVDHFIPLSRGGSNGPENLRLACPTCNYSKGGKMPWEWRPERFQP